MTNNPQDFGGDSGTSNDANASNDPLESGLRAVFASDSDREAHRSVVDILGDTIGAIRKISLPDADEDVSPINSIKSDAVTVPAQLGKFRLVGEIARGGVGAVMRARDEDIGRDIALKVLLDAHDENYQITERFVEEAQIGGQLQHPGIVPIHEMGLLAGNKPYIAMKLVKGQTLSRLLDNRQDPAADRQRFLGIFQQVCQPLAYAHGRSVVHRDLKPSNVMIGSFGEVQVMDWGLAKVLSRGGASDDERATRHAAASQIATIRSGSGSESLSGSVIGTPAYMSPEQAQGRIEDTDERSDVFGLGAILCEILTGDPPYRGETTQAIYRQARKGYLDDAMQRLDNCGADESVVELAKRCLAFESRLRPRDASVVLTDISAYLESLESRARTSEIEAAKSTAKAAAERKARRLTLALASFLVLAIVAGGSGYWWWQTEKRDSLAREQSQFQKELARADALIQEGQEALDTAASALDRAEERVPNNALAADLQRLQILTAIHKFQVGMAVVRSASDLGAIDAMYGHMFKELLGQDLFTLEQAEIETSIRELGIRQQGMEEFAVALDEWAFVRKRNGRGRMWKLPTEVAKSLDPNKAWRLHLWDDPDNEQALMNSLQRDDHVPASILCLLAGAVKSDDRGQAEALFRKVLRSEPNHFRANHGLGNMLAEEATGREDGLRYLVAANAVRPDHLRAAVALLNELIPLQEHERALDVFTHALSINSGKKEAILDWGYLFGTFLSPDQISASTAALDAWISELKAHFDPTNPHPRLCQALGNAIGHRYGDEQSDTALDWPRMVAQRTNRENPDVLSMLARVQHHVGQSAEAVRSMEEAIALDGGSHRSWLNYRLANPHPVSFVSLDAEISEKVIVPIGDTWNYFKGTEAPSPNLEWASHEFDDRLWATGPSGFGYGYGDGLEQTRLADMRDHYTTFYLRKRFSVPLTDSLTKASLLVKVDGGCVVYLNGQRLTDVNLVPESGHQALATSRRADQHMPWTRIDLTPALRDGENLIAIRVGTCRLDQWNFSFVPMITAQYSPESREFSAHLENCRETAASAENAEAFSHYIDGLHAQQLGRFEKAAEAYQEVLQLDSSRITPYIRLFECSVETQGRDEAIKTLGNQIATNDPVGFATVSTHEELKVAASFDGESFNFTASPFRSADPRIRHVKTRWEICDAEGEFRRDGVFDCISETELETLTLAAHRLEPNKAYRWRVTYQSAQGKHEIQAESTLDPQEYNQSISQFNLTAHFNADVIMNPDDPSQDSLDGDQDAFAALRPGDQLFARTAVGIHRLGDQTEFNTIQITERDASPIRITPQVAARFDALRMLMTSGWDESVLPIRLEYNDGSSKSIEVLCEDWTSGPAAGLNEAPNFLSKDFVPVLSNVDGVRASGERRSGGFIFEANVELDSAKVLSAVVLRAKPTKGHSPRPEFPSRINIFAITGVRSSAGNHQSP